MAAITRAVVRSSAVPPTRANVPYSTTRKIFSWNGSGHVADLVQEERAAVGSLERAAPNGVGAGERAFLVPEQLAFQKRVVERGTVERHQRPRRRTSGRVNRPCDQLLARAAFTNNQNRAGDPGNALDLVQELEHRGRLTDELKASLQRLAQQGILFVQAAVAFHHVQQPAQLAQQRGDPLRQVLATDEKIAGPGRNGPRRRFDAALVGYRDDRQQFAPPPQAFDQFPPIAFGRIRRDGNDHHVLLGLVADQLGQFAGLRDSPHLPIRRTLVGQGRGQFAKVTIFRFENEDRDVHGRSVLVDVRNFTTSENPR